MLNLIQSFYMKHSIQSEIHINDVKIIKSLRNSWYGLGSINIKRLLNKPIVALMAVQKVTNDCNGII